MSIKRMNENNSEKWLSSDANRLQQLMSKDVMDIISYLTRRSELSASITCIIGGMKPEKSGNAGDDPKVLIPEGLCVLFDNSPPTGESKARLMRMPSPGFVFDVPSVVGVVDRIDLIQIKADFYEANQQSRDKWVGPGAQDWSPTNFYKELSNSFLELGVVKNDTIQYIEDRVDVSAADEALGYKKLCNLTMTAGGTTNASVTIDLTEYEALLAPIGYRIVEFHNKYSTIAKSGEFHIRGSSWISKTNNSLPFEDYIEDVPMGANFGEEFSADIPIPKITLDHLKDVLFNKITASLDCEIPAGEVILCKLYKYEPGASIILIGGEKSFSPPTGRGLSIKEWIGNFNADAHYFLRIYLSKDIANIKVYGVKFDFQVGL